MKNFHTYLTFILLIVLACIPPIDFFISIPPMDVWFMLVLIAGFFGCYTLFIRTNPAVRIIAIVSFILCFFSSSPPISFTSYISIVLSCYFYINCTKIENWKIIFRAFQALLILNLLLLFMQWLGKDSLLNFGLGKDITCYGVIGHHMQMGSFSVILSAVLLPFSIFNLFFPFLVAFICNSAWTLFAAGIGCFIYFFHQNKKIAVLFLIVCMTVFAGFSLKQEKFHSSVAENGRAVVWEKSFNFALQKPWTGWGPGTYKILFPVMGMTQRHDVPYKSAHDWLVQTLFEMGVPFTMFVLCVVISLFYRLYQTKNIICLAGLSMIFVDMMAHFPDRMLQSIGIIICFLAYCEVRLHKQ